MSTRRPSRRTHTTARDYPRTARLNELLREIIADELERVDDDRLELLTVISVEIEPDLRRATVFYDNLGGADDDAEVLQALSEARVRLQRAIGRQARIKWVPELSFAPDPAIRSGARIDAILATMDEADAETEPTTLRPSTNDEVPGEPDR